ncbi:sigma-70 family RNA polymerase sigma factor [Microlunatus sp. Gsoil 973]|uniref:sigma-70 family RNA polymerase sigma factor n=1 Tax=Microlunatus sp. Gsoil 973 TaxID=2672569 RepID=UPI0012B4FC74|nr:sigma-70 family RNA polymerase sigma factor [Microlunatus sp. Gsoil 973]QGN33293.1 sigma-70 family RNA polymerase sigma factor [Microlunatus sp. Gsoil 973]
MREIERRAELFEAERARLTAIAYRMLSSQADADDAVQNAWIRLQRSDPGGIENLAGWLTAVVSRECLHLLRARRTRRETPLADREPGTATAPSPGNTPDPEAEALVADAVGPALLLILDSLAPDARLAFVLHDIFAVPHEEIAGILGRTPVACRQLASRARRRVRDVGRSAPADPVRQRRIVDAFLAAVRDGNLVGLVAVLDPDVVLTGDADSLPGPTPARLVGAGPVAEYAARFTGRARSVEPAVVDGGQGLAIVPKGRIIGALAFTCVDDLITGIELISDPERLDKVTINRADGVSGLG